MAVMWVDMGGNGGNLGVLWGIMGLIWVMGVTWGYLGVILGYWEYWCDMGVLRSDIGVLMDDVAVLRSDMGGSGCLTISFKKC